MKKAELEAKLNYYGYELESVNDKSGYKDRKKKAYGVYCRRSRKLICVYSTYLQINRWLSKSLTAKN